MTACFDVELALQAVVNRLAELNVRLDDFREKKSHEGKSLLQHAVECWNLAKEVLVRLGIDDDKLKRLCFSLCVAHDIGKLSPNWRIGERKVKHASAGGDMIFHIRGWLSNLLHLPDEYQSVFLFAVKKHHSPLFVEPKENSLGSEVSSLLLTNDKLDKTLAVNLADVIGVFKLSDMVSASGIPADLITSQYDWKKHANICEAIKLESSKKCGFNREKYELQSEIASSNTKHLVVAAPTGWGKTALSILRAEHLMPCKVFYVLPTITAIRKLVETLERIFGTDRVGEYFFFSDVENLFKRKSGEESTYLDFYRYFVPNVMVTTIDQILLSALQIGKYHLRRFNYRRSIFVFDEFHLFTPEMIGILKAFFEEFAEIYDFSVLMMSATPNTAYIKELEETLRNKGGVKCEVLTSEYEKLRRHNVEYLDKSVFDFLSETEFKKHVESEKCSVLFILNTVDNAVKVYDLLREEVKERRVHLIHGRFTHGDRMLKEESLQDAEILVSTQVAEVSLDISYDVLITECAPIPSLIQRFGRVNRYGEKPPTKTNVYICKPENNEPYTYVECKATEEFLPILGESLSCKGEKSYLEILNQYYEKLGNYNNKKIEKMYCLVKRELKKKDYFYCFDLASSNIFDILGREFNCLAVPKCYRDEVKYLKDKMRNIGYEEKRKILALIKNYFLSVPYYIIDVDGEWDEELGLYVVGVDRYAYDSQRGLYKKDV
ncbi:MAG: CRISPR-associated helicase Cas3' [Candidatus Jordarchaeales archaeon]